MTRRPLPSEYPSFFSGYVDRVPELDVVAAMRAQIDSLRRLPTVVPIERETYAYGPDKWTIRQLVGHVGDAERVFSFRALCFSRADQNALPGFDENTYVGHSRFNERPLLDLVDELTLLRSANVRMFAALNEQQWGSTGTANGKPISVLALAFVMVGHVRHHLAVLRDKYAIDAGV
ncbi:MAG TPA: DinB family protein [Vicinamibacterales bacterium]|nr:DinB family protein [Vicinamibacterales bacterium]